ncbi:MAG: hypothetical protein JWR86_611, partial [Enterovirga sp.]|nr:hypothetical protein [Enterovirga sp.]
KGEGEPGSGAGAILGVLFAIALTLAALYLIDRMQHSASLFDCAFTKAPQCRELLRN